jgi:transcriptional regulator with XRE-family HTH domain
MRSKRVKTMRIAANGARAHSVSMKLHEKLARLVENQSALARELNILPANISRYCSGQVTPPAETLFKIAQALKVSVDYLLDDSLDDPPRALSEREEMLLRYVRELGINPDDAILRLGLTGKILDTPTARTEEWIKKLREGQ